MNAKKKDSLAWYVPPEVAFQLIMPLAMLLVSLFASALLAIDLRSPTFVVVGLAVSLLGAILLFVARLPLYRQRRWFSFGPKHLTGTHRRLYFAAYVCLSVGVMMFLLLICFSNP